MGPRWHLFGTVVCAHTTLPAGVEVEVAAVLHTLVGPVDRGPRLDDATHPGHREQLGFVATYGWRPSDEEVADRLVDAFDLPPGLDVGSAAWGEPSAEERACAARYGITL